MPARDHKRKATTRDCGTVSISALAPWTISYQLGSFLGTVPGAPLPGPIDLTALNPLHFEPGFLNGPCGWLNTATGILLPGDLLTLTVGSLANGAGAIFWVVQADYLPTPSSYPFYDYFSQWIFHGDAPTPQTYDREQTTGTPDPYTLPTQLGLT